MTAGYGGGDCDDKLWCLSAATAGRLPGLRHATLLTTPQRRDSDISCQKYSVRQHGDTWKGWKPSRKSRRRVPHETQVESTILTVLRLSSHKQQTGRNDSNHHFSVPAFFYTPILERRKTCQVISHDRVPLGGPSPNTKTAMPDLKKKPKEKKKRQTKWENIQQTLDKNHLRRRNIAIQILTFCDSFSTIFTSSEYTLLKSS